MARGPDYRALAVGRRSGQIYLFANDRRDLLFERLDPASGQITGEWRTPVRDGHNWLIYEASISDDERSFFLSYHGQDTTGIDRFDLGEGGLNRCTLVPAAAGFGCYNAHGALALTADGILAATGDGSAIVLVDPLTGARQRSYDSKLEHNHLMEFAVAAKSQRLYAVGSCGYAGGLSVVDLQTAEPWVLGSPFSGSICGERIAVLDDASLVVVGRTDRPEPSLRPGQLIVLAEDGTVLRSLATPSELVDLVLVR